MIKVYKNKDRLRPGPKHLVGWMRRKTWKGRKFCVWYPMKGKVVHHPGIFYCPYIPFFPIQEETNERTDKEA
jgi:hypothetical protein